MTDRKATQLRETSETRVEISIDLDGSGSSDISTGIGFLDHLLTAFARHGRVDLELRASGDLDVDDHHTVEDVGIALGKAIDCALGTREGIVRFGSELAPLDESLARAVVDISGRGFADIDLDLKREKLGGLACENVPHVLTSLARNAGVTVHVDVLKGSNDHHKAEAAFKAFALAFRTAVATDLQHGLPSTKGVIERGTA